MTLTALKQHLQTVDTVQFKLQNGTSVPAHFHVTEVGQVTKHFIDCGGTIRKESVVNFQLWSAQDLEHRLKPGKLLNIIALSERKLGLEDLEIEVEYQSDTIGKYALDFDGSAFVLRSTATACLASDQCGVSAPAAASVPNTQACTPGSGCC